MTLFEHLDAGFTLIISFAVIRALSGFPHALRKASRYWVHVFWLSNGLLSCLGVFWGTWAFRDADWTLARYMVLLASPALLFVYTSILVPSDPAGVTSWREHFFDARVPLFTTVILYGTAIISLNYFVGGIPLFHPVLFSVYGALAVNVVGLASANPRLHSVLPFLMLAVSVIGVVTVLNELEFPTFSGAQGMTPLP